MKTIIDILSGELERLFSVAGLKELCSDFLGVSADDAGLFDDSKAVFVRRITDWCVKENAVWALADATMLLKKGMVDPRVKQIYNTDLSDSYNEGELIGSYKVLKEIDTDFLGAMYMCEPTNPDAEFGVCIVRVISREFATDKIAVQRFLTSIRIIKTQGIESTQPILDVGLLKDGRPYVVYQRLLDGDYLTSATPISIENALDVLTRVAQTLENIYEKGLVHGDIRTQNIIYEDFTDGTIANVTLTGLGTDKLLSAQSEACVSKGNPGTMAPELARGGDINVASDIYAMGILLFDMITGELPFPGKTAADIIAGHLMKPIPSLGQYVEGPVPDELNNFLAELLSKETAGRPRDIGTILRKIEDVKREVEEAEARAMQTGSREDIELFADELLSNPTDAAIFDELKKEAQNYNAWPAAIDVIQEAILVCHDDAVSQKLLLEGASAAIKYTKDYKKAIELLDQLDAAYPNLPESFEMRVSLCKIKGEYESLVELLAAKAEIVDDPAEKIAVIKEIAAIYQEKIKDLSRAFDYYGACLSGSDTDKEVIGALEKLADKTERYNDFAVACTNAVQVAESSGNAELAIYYYKKIGLTYFEKLDQAAYALTCFQKVLEYNPSDAEVLKYMAELYRSAQQWTELAQVLTACAKAQTNPSESRISYVDAAKIFYEKLSDEDTARGLLDRVLEEDPANAKAAKLLAAIYEKQEQWGRLSNLLIKTVNSMPDGTDKMNTLYMLGELYEDRLDDLKGAQEQYETVLKIDDNHLDSLKGLERIFARNSDMVSLKGNLEKQLEIAVTPKQRALLLERLAEIHEEEYKDISKSIDCYQEVLEIDPKNKSALIALTRHFRREKRYEDLVDILQARAEQAEDIDEKRELLTERAEIFKEELMDAVQAADAFQEVATLGGDSALDALASSQIEAGDFDSAQETFKRILDAAESMEDKVATMIRLASLHREKLGNIAKAVELLHQTKDLMPNNKGVAAELTQIYIAQGNYSGALENMKAELDLVEGAHSRSKIFTQMGLICMEKTNDPNAAMAHFEHALELDANNHTAGEKVAAIYRELGYWEKALPIYERWYAASDSLSQEQKFDLYTHLGEAYIAHDRRSDALDVFRNAASITDEPSVIRKLAEIATELGEHQLAVEQFARYAKAVGDNLVGEEKAKLLVLRGVANLGAGHISEASKFARQASVMIPDDMDARLLLANVHEARNDFRGAVEAREQILSELEESDERWLEMIMKTAALHFEHLKDADSAAMLLNQAHDAYPENRDVLGELLKIYNAVKRFSELADVVLEIAELVDSDAQKAKYYITAAKLFRRELKDYKEAIKYFDNALKIDPSLEDPKKAVVEMLTENRDWDQLEKHYRKCIARLPKDATAKQKLDIFVPMADLIINKLDRVKDGILIVEAIVTLDPENSVWLEKLSDLYGWATEYAEKATNLHRQLLKANPTRMESFRMLYRIGAAEEEPDRTWCAASMLSVLNQASPDERKYYKDYMPGDLPNLQERLKDELWSKLLCHEDLNQSISSIFAVAAPAIFRAKAQDLSIFGISQADLKDPGTDNTEFSQFLNFAAGSLGVAPPPIFFTSSGSDFQIVDTNPTTMAVSIQSASPKDRLGTIFKLGQQLTLQRPGHIVHRLVSSGTELSAWLLGSVKIFVQTLPVPDELAGAVQERLAPIRESLDANALERLQGYVQTFLGKNADVNLKRWSKAVNYTMDRTGLLLCGDISVATRVLKEQVTDKKQLAERLRELTLFVISEEHYQLRKHLGTALKVG